MVDTDNKTVRNTPWDAKDLVALYSLDIIAVLVEIDIEDKIIVIDKSKL